MSENLIQAVREKAQKWLSGNYDEDTKHQVEILMKNDEKELIESFYKDLEFGTGGLRGIMGVGTNRMNKYTVGMATQGLVNYLKKQFPGETIRAAISYDSRNNSREFARITADIFTANDCQVYLFESLRPTPELSFAVRELGCHSGVMLTASHNPKEYNGYKAYWNDGAQITAPHDTNIIEEVGMITSVDQVKFTGKPENLTPLGANMDKAYLEALHTLTLSPGAIAKHADMKIVYTPLHGTGITVVPQALQMFGFTHVSTVEAQSTPDGNFPTVSYPNPEEPAAMKLAVEQARSQGAELVLATDPDADRVGAAVPDGEGGYVLLNGNQTASILTYYILRRWKEEQKLHGNEFIIKTIVTTELIEHIARSFGVEYYNCLTGFKYIAEVIRKLEGVKRYICGGEESYGFLVGDFVRDKDAVISCAMLAEAAAWAKTQGTSLYGLLKQIYVEYGFFKEGMLAITKQGKEGAEEIAGIMAGLRAHPPKTICGAKVTVMYDYELLQKTDLATGSVTPIDEHQSNVLQFITNDNTIVSARPSGTEPKIKFYFGVREELDSPASFSKVEEQLDRKIEQIKTDLKLN